MPRRTHPLLLATALAVGLLLALGVAACGGSGSQSAETLDKPPLTVGTDATLLSGSARSTTRTTSTTSTTGDAADDAGTTDPGVDAGAVDDGVDADTGAADTGAGDTAGGAPSTGAADGGTDTPTPTAAEPTNPGGAAPNYQNFCDENPGAC